MIQNHNIYIVYIYIYYIYTIYILYIYIYYIYIYYIYILYIYVYLRDRSRSSFRSTGNSSGRCDAGAALGILQGLDVLAKICKNDGIKIMGSPIFNISDIDPLCNWMF